MLALGAARNRQSTPSSTHSGPSVASEIEVRWLEPGTDTMVISRGVDASPVAYRHAGAGWGIPSDVPGRIQLGVTIQTVRHVRAPSGIDVLEIAFEQRDSQSVVAQTTTWVDAQSLQPIRQQALLEPGHVVNLSFADGRVAMVDLAPGQAPRSFEAALPESAYASSALDLVLRALPLADGYRTTVPLYFPAEQMVYPVTVRVEGAERIMTRSGRAVDCWVVAGDFPGEITERFWIEQRSHAMIRILAHDGPMALVRYDR